MREHHIQTVTFQEHNARNFNKKHEKRICFKKSLYLCTRKQVGRDSAIIALHIEKSRQKFPETIAKCCKQVRCKNQSLHVAGAQCRYRLFRSQYSALVWAVSLSYALKRNGSNGDQQHTHDTGKSH